MYKFACLILVMILSIFTRISYSSNGEQSWKELSIVSENDPILKKKSLAVSDDLFSSIELKQLTESLAQEMFSHFRILGIAAPQMGLGLRVFLLRSNFINPFDHSYEVYINPSIEPVEGSTKSRIEFCLSLKGFHWIRRHKAIKLKFYTLDGTQKLIELTGSRARIAQHELDHLDGKLITDE